MKKVFIFITLLFFIFCEKGFAQFSRYVIQLKDKAATPYAINNPAQFLSQRAIDRRTRYSIAIDSTDLPVNPAYIDSIRLSGNVSIINISKWMNQVCIKTTDATALAKINAFGFVVAAPPIAARPARIIQAPNDKWDDQTATIFNDIIYARPESPQNFYAYGAAYAQIHIHNGEFLHNHGFRGDAMQMAITDEGFYHYNVLPTFDSIRINNKILDVWNYVSNSSNVDEGIGHGMDCLSTIAANMPGNFVGTAPRAAFYLYVTEDISSEYPIEEQNWLAAAEKADSLGVDVISVSLGYNTFDNSVFDYTYNDLNGNKTIIAKAVNIASRKGMLVVAAAGNSGNDTWHYIETPGDADSALTVGAVDSNGVIASFSSYGPNSNGQTKPDVAAVGANAIVANEASGQPSFNSGTSFSTPIMAGLATCLWQAFPEVKNIDIIDALHKAADRTNNLDDRTGYGIPDLKKAFVGLIKKLHTQQTSISNCSANLSWTAKSAADMNFVIERKLPTDINYQPIDTQFIQTDFVKNGFTYSDDLTQFPTATTVQYRIRMNIAADTSFYLDSATLNYSTNCSSIIPQEKITVNPNPVSDNLTVMIVRNNPAPVSIELYSSTGQKIYVADNQQTVVSQTYLIPMTALSHGIYYVDVLIDNKKLYTQKIVH